MAIDLIDNYLSKLDSELNRSDRDELIKERIHAIESEISGEPVLFYGVGGSTHKLFEKFSFKNFNIQGFLDSDKVKQGRFYQGKKIHSPEYIDKSSILNIVICANESRYQIRDYVEKEFKKPLRIFSVYDGVSCDDLPIKNKIYNLEKKKRNAEDYKELIDLYLFTRSFNRALAYYDEFKSKFPDSTYYASEFISQLRSMPEKIKNSFISNTESNQPNICLITIDTARLANMSCYGYSRDTTPFLRKLSKNSIFCKKSYSTSNWTIPSHGSIFTGKMPFDHGACTRFSRLKDDPDFLTKKLKQSGYNTYGFVNIPFLHPRYGFGQGYDIYQCFDKWNYASGTFWEAFQNIDKHKPFFLFLNFIEAHDPYDCSHYEWGDANTDGEILRKMYANGKREIENNLIEKTINVYDDGIRSIDEAIEYYFDFFPDNTVFVFTSDHGELFGENQMFGHLNVALHDNVIGVPIIIAGKKITPQIVENPVSISDLYSTILQISESENIRINKRSDYVFAERMKETQSLNIDPHEFGNDVRLISDGAFKLVEYSDGVRKFFKLPDETINLIENPSYKNKIEELYSALVVNRGEKISPQINSLSDKELNQQEKKKIEERLAALGYL